MPGHELQVVEREHVRRVDHRDHQPLAALVEPDRGRVVALGSLRGHQVERPRVELVDRKVDEVEPEALGDRTGELLRRQVARVNEDLLGVRPADFASSTAAFTRSAEVKPSSAITSEMNRAPPPRLRRRDEPVVLAVGERGLAGDGLVDDARGGNRPQV